MLIGCEGGRVWPLSDEWLWDQWMWSLHADWLWDGFVWSLHTDWLGGWEGVVPS